MTTTNRPTRQQNRSRRTRDQIASAALSVFATKGYAESSMDDICTSAGCSKGGLYHHFPAKAAVLEVVIARLRALDGLAPPLASASGATGLPEGLLERLLVDLWAETARSPQLRASMNGSAAAATMGEVLNDIMLIGQMVQRLTQTPDAVPEAAAIRPAA